MTAFLMFQFSCLYMTTGKIIALTIRTFVSKMMSLLFNTLSRFEILEANERVPEVEYLSMCGFPIDLETVLLELKSDHIVAWQQDTVQADFGGTVGWVPDRLNKMNLAVKWVTGIFGFLMHIKVKFTLYLLSIKCTIALCLKQYML